MLLIRGTVLTRLHVVIAASSIILATFCIFTAVFFVLAASLTGTNVEPATLVAGASGTATISFTTTTTIPADGKIVVTFPNGFKVNTAGGGACSTMDGTFVTNVSGQTVTLTRQNNGTGEVGAAETCTINNVVNPNVAGSGGTYTISTTDAANVVLDTDASVAADTFTAGALTNTSVNPASLAVGVTGSVTASFTMANGLENNGKIAVIFPAGFNVAGANNPTCNMDGTFALGINSQTLTITRSGGTGAPSGVGFNCTFQGVANPGSPGVTGTYTIQTMNSTGAIHDQNANVAGSTIVTPTLTSTNVQPANLNTGSSTTVTISFTTTHAVPANGKIRVTFPNGFGVSGAAGGTCSTMNGTFATSVGGQQVILTRQNDGGSESVAAETCTVNNIINPSITGGTGNYQIETLDGANSVIDSDTSVTADNIVAAALTSTNVQPASLVASTTNTVTVTFTTTVSIENNGKIQTIFPAGFNVSGANTPTCSSMDGNFATNVGGQTVTITRSAGTPAAPGAHTCTFQGIVNPGATGTTGTYTIQTTNGANQLHNIDNAVPGDVITGAPASLTSTNVQPAVLTTGSSNTVTISFTTTHAVPANGKIRVTFPNGFGVSGAAGGACSTMNGTFVTSVAGQQVILTRQNDGGSESVAAETCTVNSIINPGTAGTTTNYQIETLDNANGVIDVDSAVPGDTIVAATLTGTNVEPASLVVSTSNTVTISYTSTNTLESNGKIAVIFPAGFNVSGAGPTSCAGMDGTFNHNISSQTVTIQRNGSTLAGPGSYTCTIGAVVNPAATGAAGTYSIQTMNNTGGVHDSDTAVAGDTMISASAGVLTSTNVQPATLVAGASGTTTATFTTASALPANGKVRITFPAGYSLASVVPAVLCTGFNGTMVYNVASQAITITRQNDGASTGAPAAISCTIPSVVNPGVSGSTGTYSIETLNNANGVIDADMAVAADTITAGALSSTNVEPASLVAGSIGTTTVTFTTANAIPNNGKVKVTFPAAFAVAGVSGVSCSSSMDGGFNFGISGQVVTIQRAGNGTSSAPGAKTCTIQNIQTPTSSGSTGTYTITTAAGNDATIDTDAAVAADTVTAAALTGTNVEPASLVASTTNIVTLSFTTANKIGLNGKVKTTFPAGFDVTGASGGTCSGMDGSFTTTVSGQIVTIARSGASIKVNAGAQTCTIANILNPATPGSTGTYTLATTDGTNAVQDIDASVAADTITASVGALSGTNVEPAALTVGATGTVTISFTTVNSIPSDGKILVTFGNGFLVAGASGGTCSSMDGSFATSISGQSVILTRSGGTIRTSGAQTCTVGGIVNPAVSGSTGTYNIQTTQSNATVIDQNLTVTADTIIAATLTGTNVQPATLATGATGAATVFFTTVSVIQITGKIVVTFPGGFDVSGAVNATCIASMNGSFSTGVSGQTVTITRSGGTTSSVGAKTCTIGGIVNPTITGSTGTYAITTTTAGDVVQETDANVPADSIAATALSSANVTPASLVAGATGDVAVVFMTSNALEHNGKIIITFPSTFDVSAVSAASCGPSLNGSFTVGVVGQVVTITRTGGSVSGPGAKACTVSGIRNPVVAGSAGTYAIVTAANSGAIHDANLGVPANTILAATLASADVVPAQSRISATNTVTVAFTTVNALESTGKISVTFPSGFIVSAAISGTCSGMNGAFATNASGQNVVLTRSGGDIAPPGAYTCTFGGIGNPPRVGVSGTYRVFTTNAADQVHDSIDVAGDTFVAPASDDSGSSSGGTTSTSATYDVSVTSPTGLRSYQSGTTVPLVWSTSGTGSVSAVNIYYSADGGIFWTVVAQRVSNSGQYSWTLPETGTTKAVVKIEATDLVTILATDISPVFTVVGPAAVADDTSSDVPVSETPNQTDTTEVPSVETPSTSDSAAPAELSEGMFVRGSENVVYYVNADGTISPFPDIQTFFTYAKSFDDVVSMSDIELSSHPIAKMMTPKAGTVLVKIPAEHYVYAIENIGGTMTLRWLVSEAVASTVYGSDWSRYVLDIVSSAWGSFSRGSDVNTPADIQVDPTILHTRDELNSH